jgi:hypothetical protein
VNPSVARLAIVVALVVGGVAVLANGFADEEAAAAAPDGSTTTSPSVTQTPSQTPQQSVVPQQEGVLVQVLNGTSVAGYAADFQTVLVEQGGYLEAGDPGDAPDKPVLDSIVYFRPDDNAAQNRADARFLSDEYLGGVPVERLPADLTEPLVDPTADVIVVLGDDQAGEA